MYISPTVNGEHAKSNGFWLCHLREALGESRWVDRTAPKIKNPHGLHIGTDFGGRKLRTKLLANKSNKLSFIIL